MLHEIGHALGFKSNLILLDNLPPGSNDKHPFWESCSKKVMDVDMTEAKMRALPLDLFIRSSESLLLGPGVIDWTLGIEKRERFLFTSQPVKSRWLARQIKFRLTEGRCWSGGSQIGHWHKMHAGRLMKQGAVRGDQPTMISFAEIMALDAVGYDVDSRLYESASFFPDGWDVRDFKSDILTR